MHRITQEIPRRARAFGYGPFTLYGAAFQKLHLTFALPQWAPTTPDSFLRSAQFLESSLLGKERFETPAAFLIEFAGSKHMNESGLACSAFARHY